MCQSVPYSSQADVWSLGCVLYELCTLSHAFAADSLYSLIFRVMNGTYTPIDTQRYSAGMTRLVSSMLNKEPGRRPSCSALLADPFVKEHIDRMMMRVCALLAAQMLHLEKVVTVNSRTGRVLKRWCCTNHAANNDPNGFTLVQFERSSSSSLCRTQASN